MSIVRGPSAVRWDSDSELARALAGEIPAEVAAVAVFGDPLWRDALVAVLGMLPGRLVEQVSWDRRDRLAEMPDGTLGVVGVLERVNPRNAYVLLPATARERTHALLLRVGAGVLRAGAPVLGDTRLQRQHARGVLSPREPLRAGFCGVTMVVARDR